MISSYAPMDACKQEGATNKAAFHLRKHRSRWVFGSIDTIPFKGSDSARCVPSVPPRKCKFREIENQSMNACALDNWQNFYSFSNLSF